MTARDERDPELGRPRRIAPLSDDCAALVDVGVLLAPDGRYARVTLVKDFERFPTDQHPARARGRHAAAAR